MDSWWDLGEELGYRGAELAISKITCPFCLHSGNFKVVAHKEKKHHQDIKVLNFDTLECGNCNGYVLVLWSVNSSGINPPVHDFKVLPWPLTYVRYPDHWPETVGRNWLQAKRNLLNQNWDAAAIMARTALQAALRDKNAKMNNLKNEINDLAQKGILPPLMKEWSENVRVLGNESAHPNSEQGATNPQDAKDVIRFLDFLMVYLYNLPEQIKKYRERGEK